ncbi:MAG: ATP-binding protein [Chthoniobacteraceae bacterium]|nr:ATP-binding protein [Chthoniobacteraceae bacterium]
MGFFSNTGLRLRLTLVVLLAIVPMFGLLLYQAAEDRNRKLAALEEDAGRMAETAAGNLSQVVEGARQLLFTLAYAEPVRQKDGPVASALFAELLRHSSNYLNIGLAESRESNLASAIPPSGLFGPGERPWFERFRERRDFSVGTFQQSKTVKRPTLVISYPLPGQVAGQPPAAVYAALNLDALQACVSGHQRIPGVVAVLDRNGVELARTPDAQKWVGQRAPNWETFVSRASKSKNTEGVVTIGVDGVPRIYFCAPVPGSDNGLFVAVGVAKETLLQAVRTDFLRNLFWLGAFTLAALGCAWFFADFSVIRHVKRLTAASRRLAEGKWETPTQLPGGARELQQLAQAFDDMAVTLRSHQDLLEEQVHLRTRQLLHTNGLLKEEIDERKQAESASKKLLAELRRSNQELEQFAYVASHDLQEPLRLVSAYTQLLLQRYRSRLDAEAEPIVHFITEGVNRMQQLIRDLLAYSRVGSKSRPFAMTDVEEILASVLQNLAMTIQEHGAVVTHDSLPAILCDPVLLGQLFQNLIANGIKFHGEEPPLIHVGARKTDDGAGWLFAVSDNGIGIDPEYFERIFVIFQRLHTRAKYPGTGIGLAICKRIVERHGGEIWVESSPGKGCIFFFTIPLKPEIVTTEPSR